MSLETEYQKAFAEVGAIVPWWSQEDGMFVFEHPAYPFVVYADPDAEKAAQGYQRALKLFVVERLQGNVADDIDQVTSGRGGARVGAGRPRKPTKATQPVRVPSDIAPVLTVWIKSPQNAQKLRDLLQA